MLCFPGCDDALETKEVLQDLSCCWPLLETWRRHQIRQLQYFFDMEPSDLRYG